MDFPQILDANINRASEGLRTIEDYVRFVKSDKGLSAAFSELRKKINNQFPDSASFLNKRNTYKDARAREIPVKRGSLRELLTANFKRVGEALRVLEEYTGNPLFNESRYTLYELEKEVLLPLYKKEIRKGIYLISDQPEVLEKGLEWRVAMVQLRDKKSPKSVVLEKAYQMKHLSAKHGVPFIVNDYADIALLTDADGFHSGQDDISVAELRRILGPHKIIGRTTHSPEQGKAAEQEGADYVSVGPIWETPSKPGREGIGFDYLAAASTLLNIPYVAIGGITIKTIPDILPFSPPLIGVVRDYAHIPDMQRLLKNIPSF